MFLMQNKLVVKEKPETQLKTDIQAYPKQPAIDKISEAQKDMLR